MIYKLIIRLSGEYFIVFLLYTYIHDATMKQIIQFETDQLFFSFILFSAMYIIQDTY